MTIEELLELFPTGYRFSKATGLTGASWYKWKQQGYIPLDSQYPLEIITNGKLKARFEDVPFKMPKRYKIMRVEMK